MPTFANNLNLWKLSGLVALFLTCAPMNASEAQECAGRTCIDVSAGGKGDLIITVRKGAPGGATTSSPKPIPEVSKSPTAKPIPPKATPSRRATPRTTTPTSRPAKSTPRPKVSKSPGLSLMEQVRRMLPDGILITQPYAAILVREPIYFMTTIPKKFETVIVVLEVPIQLSLTADYLWDFGDGETQRSSNPGAPYPVGEIRHSYGAPGAKTLRLTVNWSGTWRAGGISGPIKGTIRTEFERELTIRSARTHLNQ